MKVSEQTIKANELVEELTKLLTSYSAAYKHMRFTSTNTFLKRHKRQGRAILLRSLTYLKQFYAWELAQNDTIANWQSNIRNVAK